METEQKPFYVTDNFEAGGMSYYFRSKQDAEVFQQNHGGYIIETTKYRIWRVTIKSDNS